jgi:hypothetical protein
VEASVKEGKEEREKICTEFVTCGLDHIYLNEIYAM